MSPDDATQDIWLLTDHRVGTNKQTIALADSIGKPYTIKQLRYHKYLSYLPNWLLRLWPMHVTNKNEILADTRPDLIIAAGRRAAAMAAHIKRTNQKPVKLVQIMRPGLSSGLFDLLVIPKHDSFSDDGPNIIRTEGALTDISARLKSAKEQFHVKFQAHQEFIAVNIGGLIKGWQFSANDAKLITKKMYELSTSHQLPYFITFSRRTPSEVKHIFEDNFTAEHGHVIYDPASNKPNPYPGMITAAKYILSTPDSISMLSESLATGQPVYVFEVENFKSPKHQAFISSMKKSGRLKIITTDLRELVKYSYSPLNELARVTAKTKEIL